MKVLLLSDESLDVNKGGFPQTLYNIFSFIPPRDFLLVTSSKTNFTSPSTAPFTERVIVYNFEVFTIPKNRLATYLNKTINWINYSFNTFFRSFATVKSAIKEFDPDVVIVAPNNAESLFMYDMLKSSIKNKKVFPYFMDDWMEQSQIKWAGGNAKTLAKDILKTNENWLVISKSLSGIFEKRYKLKPKKILEIHNPVDLGDLKIVKPLSGPATTIAYAGSLWPMHYDAFLIAGRAISFLKSKREIKLVVYTSESHWQWRKNDLIELGVEYGGSIPYSEIHNKLSEAHCLLLTSSFSKKWHNHSVGSVQTKITDYLKAQRLIISCGPSYSANHSFLKKYNCGLCIETENVNEAAEKLNNILVDIKSNQCYPINGLEVLKQEFSFEKVHNKLKQFLVEES